MPGPRPLHYRPLIFHPVGEGFIPPGLFAPPPASAGRRGRRPLQLPVRLCVTANGLAALRRALLTILPYSIQSVLFDKILIKGDFLLIVTGARYGYTKAIASKSQAAPNKHAALSSQEVHYVLFRR